MNAKIRVTLLYFLSVLEKKLLEDKIETISPIFLKIFSKEELFDILSSMYNGTIPDGYLSPKYDAKDILEAIGDQRFILCYIIGQWEKEMECHGRLSEKKTKETLCKLGLENHYLAQKPISAWDKYDKNNYRALLSKGQKKSKMYGIFDVNVKEDDKYTCTSPARAFPTKWEAEIMLCILITQGGFLEGELKIMAL